MVEVKGGFEVELRCSYSCRGKSLWVSTLREVERYL